MIFPVSDDAPIAMERRSTYRDPVFPIPLPPLRTGPAASLRRVLGGRDRENKLCPHIRSWRPVPNQAAIGLRFKVHKALWALNGKTTDRQIGTNIGERVESGNHAGALEGTSFCQSSMTGDGVGASGLGAGQRRPNRYQHDRLVWRWQDAGAAVEIVPHGTNQYRHNPPTSNGTKPITINIRSFRILRGVVAGNSDSPGPAEKDDCRRRTTTFGCSLAMADCSIAIASSRSGAGAAGGVKS